MTAIRKRFCKQLIAIALLIHPWIIQLLITVFLLNALLEILFLFHNKFEFLKSFLVYVCENHGVTDLFSLLHGLDMIEFFFWYNVLEQPQHR